MIKLKLKESSDAIFQSECLFTFSREGNYSYIEINLLDIESGLEKTYHFNWETVYIPSFIQRANNELLCFGSFIPTSHESAARFSDNVKNFLYIIDYSKMKTKRILAINGSWYRGCGVASSNDSIYIFTGIYSSTFAALLKYDTSRNRLIKLAEFKFSSSSCYCIWFEGKILIGSEDKLTYAYDLHVNSYSKISLIASEGRKLFTLGSFRAYCIEFKGYIYESEFKNPYAWNLISVSILRDKINGLRCVSWNYYNGCFFLRENLEIEGKYYPENSYISFNLANKSFHKHNISKKKCQIY